jgi:hypothetical protein
VSATWLAAKIDRAACRPGGGDAGATRLSYVHPPGRRQFPLHPLRHVGRGERAPSPTGTAIRRTTGERAGRCVGRARGHRGMTTPGTALRQRATKLRGTVLDYVIGSQPDLHPGGGLFRPTHGTPKPSVRCANWSAVSVIPASSMSLTPPARPGRMRETVGLGVSQGEETGAANSTSGPGNRQRTVRKEGRHGPPHGRSTGGGRN